MTETTGLRRTGITAYRRYVIEQIVAGLRLVFSEDYDRERQFNELKISPTYPLQKLDYPAMMITFEDRSIQNAGVGHVEWFNDNTNVLRQWFHRRFEGTLSVTIFALSPLDCDLLCDGLIETLSFGRLDSQMVKFFIQLYGDPDAAQASLVLQQLMLNTDMIQGSGGNVTIAPWQPEDVLVYSRTYSMDLHGGIYNAVNPITYDYVSDVDVQPYASDTTIVLPFDPLSSNNFSNPFIHIDRGAATGDPVISGLISSTVVEEGTVIGDGIVSGSDILEPTL